MRSRNQSQNTRQKLCRFCPRVGQSNCHFPFPRGVWMVPVELLLLAKDEKCHKNSLSGSSCLSPATSQDQATLFFPCSLTLPGYFAFSLTSQWPGPVLSRFASSPCILFGMEAPVWASESTESSQKWPWDLPDPRCVCSFPPQLSFYCFSN